MTSGNELTVLLTLKDRGLYTLRWMNYVNSIAFPFKILIADGGSDQSVPDMLSDKMRFRNVNYDYVRYPPDKTYTDYYRKVVDALARVRTPFVVLADNDDFYVVETMREAVRVLSANPDYVSCGGEGAHFWVPRSPLNECKDLLYGKDIEWKCTRHAHSVVANTARERLRSQSLSVSDVFWYDVKRIEEARKQFEMVLHLDLADLFLVETLVQFLTAISGKTKRLERMYIARQYNSPKGSGAMHTEKYGSWFDRMLTESWSDDFAKFVNAVSNGLAAADDISISEAKTCVVASYRMLVAPSLLSDILEEPTVRTLMPIIAAVVRRLVRLPEYSVPKRFMRELYRGTKWISLDSVYGERVFAKPVSNSQKDFKPILKFLASADNEYSESTVEDAFAAGHT
jgi:glycosyltransferase domain-containing protein